MKLRTDVFVVEQACAYAELDGLDLLPDTAHIFAMTDGLPIAYARILATDSSSTAVQIGRVLVASTFRRRGLATALMHRVLAFCEMHHARCDQVLAAQVEVVDFYSGLGFESCGKPFMEDGIAHVNMQRSPS